MKEERTEEEGKGNELKEGEEGDEEEFQEKVKRNSMLKLIIEPYFKASKSTEGAERKFGNIVLQIEEPRPQMDFSVEHEKVAFLGEYYSVRIDIQRLKDYRINKGTIEFSEEREDGRESPVNKQGGLG